jgi:syntaxin-binding protein 1
MPICRVLSSAAKMSEILDCNVSVVEDLHKNREPLPLVAVYFVQPTNRNVERILADFPEGEAALYQSVHIFFSSQVVPSFLR